MMRYWMNCYTWDVPPRRRRTRPARSWAQQRRWLAARRRARRIVWERRNARRGVR